MSRGKRGRRGKEGAAARSGDDQEDEDERETSNQDSFHNYKPPLRLIILELTAIILLTNVLFFKPNGFSAISMKGADTVGLLSKSLYMDSG